MPPERIILMYISEVSGHHSATLAIEKAINLLSPKARVLNINAFNFTNPISEKIINRIYMSVIQRTPRVWDYLYDNQAVVKRLERIKKTIHNFNSPKFKELFDEFRPGAVACSQAYPCGMVADYKKKYGSKIPLVAVLTDYVPHAYWVYDTINYYITPSEEVTQRLIKKGVSREKIRPFGIPIDPKFIPQQAKDKARRNLGLSAEKFTILIMGGGHGLGPIRAIIKTLDSLKEDLQAIVVTGVNKKLFFAVSKDARQRRKKFLIFEYVNNIDELMSASDIIITKPGGITTAEALAKKLPMVIVKPIPGQEINNTVYLTGQQAAIKIDDIPDIAPAVSDMITNTEKIRKFSDAAARISKPSSSMDIARLLLELCCTHV